MLRKFFGAALVTCLMAGSAHASTMLVEQQDASDPFGAQELRGVVKFVTDPVGPLSAGTRVYAGAFQLTNSVIGDFVAFCIDIQEALALPKEYEAAPNLFLAPTRDKISNLYATSYDDITNKTRAAAFQVALWNIIYDTDLDVTTGALAVTSGNGSIMERANEFLAAADAYAGPALYDLAYYKTENGQDLVFIAPVPLPAAGAMLLAGIGGFAALRRRKR